MCAAGALEFSLCWISEHILIFLFPGNHNCFRACMAWVLIDHPKSRRLPYPWCLLNRKYWPWGPRGGQRLCQTLPKTFYIFSNVFKVHWIRKTFQVLTSKTLLYVMYGWFSPQNLIAQSQSGTGKTAAFVLAMLSHVDSSKKYPQVSFHLSLLHI